MTPFIRLKNVSKSFGEVVAVNKVNLEINQGELFCLLGSSGSGKTTLLRMLAGFERPDEGIVEIDGINMDGVDPADRPVNIMFQNYALFPHYSVARNIGYGLVRDGMRGSELESRIEELLKLVRLEGYGNRKPHQLSGGQRQRVALARALARRPKLLLLDEPLAALDKKLREDTQFELVTIQEQLGTTFMVVTHDQEEAMVLADRIGVMEHGELVQVDTPKTLYEKPGNRFVADFLGSVSFLDASVKSATAKSLNLSIGDSNIAAQPDAATMDNLAPGQQVTVAIRPEKILLSRTRPKHGNVIPVAVEDMAFTGVATFYRVRDAAGNMLKIHQQNRHDTDSLTWDDQGFASFDPANVIVLTD